eukprot:TRINITY_DN3749_c0_g1_i1.p1 TRINITY_DN3749_c0_g1~~TRINITY_DN3749_c0_g1_i1.p1  ORF type:complete len:296 (+),score=64.32 TRINITY_DN3749_c0_g1_i1:168-1055(+)
MNPPVLLFPKDHQSVLPVDYSFLSEYNVSKENEFPTFIYDHDALTMRQEVVLFEDIEKFTEERCAILRGWMLNDVQYALFYDLLLEKFNLRLINSPEAYNLMHYFPNVYSFVESYTAESMWFPCEEFDDVHLFREEIEDWLEKCHKFIVKDYVKSAKSKGFLVYEHENGGYDEFLVFLKKVYVARGKLFNKGFVFKKYISDIKKSEFMNEIRGFVLNKQIISICGNNNREVDVPQEIYDMLGDLAEKIESNFYTVDFIECEDNWKIIECGDGQVSGLATEQYEENFYERIYELTH